MNNKKTIHANIIIIETFMAIQKNAILENKFNQLNLMS